MNNKIPPVKKLTALALTQPRETLPKGDYSRVIFLDNLFKVKITDCIQREELMETLKTYQLN